VPALSGVNTWKKRYVMSIHRTRHESNGQLPRRPPGTLRLKLKPKAPATGYVDGAWWPRSLDLSIELPPLLDVLAIRLGRIERVSYNLTAWDAAPRRIHVDGLLLRLGGFQSQNAHTVDVIGLNGRRVTLLVVPPRTGEAVAHRILMKAGRRDNVDAVDELLALVATDEPDLPDPAVERWEVEGGHLYAPV
jgi:hypothetical protein